MDNRDTRVATALDRLFRTYPQSVAGDPEALALDRIERAQVYFEGLAGFDVRDIEAAVTSFLSGSAPGVNPNFAPPAPAVSAECRRQMNLRLDREARDRKALPPPASDRVEITQESRGRVAAMVADMSGKLGDGMRTSEAAADARRSVLRRANETFVPDMSDEAIARRLGYSVGDRDGVVE